MSGFAIQITNGCLRSDIDQENQNAFDRLVKLGALKLESDKLYRLDSLHRAGRLYLGKDGRGYVEASQPDHRDLLVEPENLNDARRDDIVVVKRFIAKRGRASGKIVEVIEKAHLYTIAYTHKDELGNFMVLDVRNGEPTTVVMGDMDISAFKIGTVFKVDIDDNRVIEVFGHLDDPKVDEKISLHLYDRHDLFPEPCVSQAVGIEHTVTASEHPNRVDLRNMEFCTIDPVTAKDFDDAIYFDTATYTLYVAIADVSHYVEYFTDIDKEAKRRGFTTYFPHKSFPMLPRELSENICSLKPQVDRLAFVAKVVLDKDSIEPISEEFFEAIIHSKHRFNYNSVDRIIETNAKDATDIVKSISKWLLPLHNITTKLRSKRLKKGFDFRSEETKISLDATHMLKSTEIETGTPSHSLIEECMLLANQASAKRFKGDGDGIFRIHEPPQLARTEALLSELAVIGIFVEEYEDSPSLIRAIQLEASKVGLESEVDAMIIKSLRQANYSAFNSGHFGLGYKYYSHFTSPIRRYPDLILHRLIKAQILQDSKQMEYLLRNIEPLAAKCSDLERASTKAEWDFRDRKFARWAETQRDKTFLAQIVETGESAKAVLLGDIKGVTVNLKGDNLMLFDEVRVKINEVNIAQAVIMAELTE